MANRITFINEKGGVGKTSLAFNTAWELALKKRKVLLIDLDGQRANLTFFTGIERTENMKTMFDVLVQNFPIKEAVKQVRENFPLYIIPANEVLTNLGSNTKVSKLRKSLDEINDDYDYIFFDVNPSPDWRQVLAMSVSKYLVIPMLPDITSLEADVGITESIREIQETTNPNLKVLGIVFNRNTNRTNLSKEVKEIAEKTAKGLGSKVFKTKIRGLVALSENVHSHVGITEYDPSSTAAKDYKDFVKELEKEVKSNG
ncbi:MAG: ParA family protein [Lachnospiraceae bacterium]|nr:ParA family protein [Lachnospiraceae bacterium]